MIKCFIAGNWKMNTTVEEGKSLASSIIENLNSVDLGGIEIALSVPFTHITEIHKIIKDTNIKIAAQNCHFEIKGAFTGEISPETLKDMGVTYVLLGHSERRQYFAETDEIVNKKVVAALKSNLKPIICVGETSKQREENNHKQVVKCQIEKAFLNVKEIENITIAYEPVWAIGTDVVATTKEAEEMCLFIRQTIEDLYNKSMAESILIQYGGSMNKENAKELLGQKNINGGLIGGASLKAEDFITIINSYK
ncbi:MAG: triose-phosphate isomerase [Oscillospiraceae bacterium]